MTFRTATLDDCPRLAELNHQLIRDEGHRNRMAVPELEQRMRGWLSEDYRAIIYEDGDEVVAYALCEQRHSVEVGSFLFVPAGWNHRFEDFSSDFVAWVVFYGSEGGEPEAI